MTRCPQTQRVDVMSRSLYLSVIWHATRRFHARFASRAQMRRCRVIHLSDAVAQFERASRRHCG